MADPITSCGTIRSPILQFYATVLLALQRNMKKSLSFYKIGDGAAPLFENGASNAAESVPTWKLALFRVLQRLCKPTMTNAAFRTITTVVWLQVSVG